jgi:glycosyltransferase involved in cell wall biosynthesis
VRRLAADARDLLSPPAVTWLEVVPEVRMIFAPNASEKRVPNGDIVVATAWGTAEPVSRYGPAKGKGFYLIQTIEYLLGTRGDETPLRSAVEATWRLPLRKAAVSEWIARAVREITGDPAPVVITPGIDTTRFRSLRPLEDRPFRVTMMYSDDLSKGSADGIAAIRFARKSHPDLLATLFGTTRLPRGLEPWMEYRRDLRQGPLVDLYNETRVFVCSSIIEGFSLPPAEAMACGCAVVSTDCGGNREYAEDGVTALLSPPRDAEALARNLRAVLSDPSLLRKLAAGGRARMGRHDWESRTDRLEEFFRSA